jgi:hypothetical protein
MYTVDYGYYNYPMKTREFKTYASANSFFNYIRKNPAVKRVELKCP